MKVYILQVHTGYEHQTARRARQLAREHLHDNCRIIVHSLERELRIKSRGRHQIMHKPLYPGYIFIESDCSKETLLNIVRSIQTAVRFLQSNSDITPLLEHEEKNLRHLMHYGPTIPRSKVELRPNERIRIIEGPLQGLEGVIERVDKRRERVRIRLEMSNKPFRFDVGIEIVQPQESDPKESA
ncbi:MAG: antiterminator LoaP [Spirochaeta sp.]